MITSAILNALIVLKYIGTVAVTITLVTVLVFLGIVPMLLYGILYLYMVVISKKWEDFYGFNKTGKWPISFVLMTVGSFLISLILWLV